MTRLTILCLLLLTGCMSQEQQLALQNSRDDQQCLSYGAQKGSDTYVNCRTQLATNRSNAEAMRRAAVLSSTTCTGNVCY